MGWWGDIPEKQSYFTTESQVNLLPLLMYITNVRIYTYINIIVYIILYIYVILYYNMYIKDIKRHWIQFNGSYPKFHRKNVLQSFPWILGGSILAKLSGVRLSLLARCVWCCVVRGAARPAAPEINCLNSTPCPSSWNRCSVFDRFSIVCFFACTCFNGQNPHLSWTGDHAGTNLQKHCKVQKLEMCR